MRRIFVLTAALLAAASMPALSHDGVVPHVHPHAHDGIASFDLAAIILLATSALIGFLGWRYASQRDASARGRRR